MILLQLDPDLAIGGLWKITLEAIDKSHTKLQAGPAAHCFSRLARARRRGAIGDKSRKPSELDSRAGPRLDDRDIILRGGGHRCRSLRHLRVARWALEIVRVWSAPKRRRTQARYFCAGEPHPTHQVKTSV